MTRRRSARIPSIDGVAARFRQWRRTRQKKTAIPDELWSAAVEMARRDGVNRTAAALHLDGGKLKRLMMSSDSAPRKAMPPRFVELMAPGEVRSAADLPEYTIELEGPNGNLRIHCKGTTAVELAALSRALWDFAS